MVPPRSPSPGRRDLFHDEKPSKLPGFTLIELVITIALAGIVMMMIAPFFQSGITDQPPAGPRLQDAVTVQRVMENINGAYGMIAAKTTAALHTLSANYRSGRVFV